LEEFMTRVVPGARPRLSHVFGATGAVLIALLGFTGCPGSIDPSLIGMGNNQPCDATPIFTAKGCNGSGICHDAMGSAANFNMASDGWQTHLVGVNPMGGGAIASMCSTNGPYLAAGQLPATGLFLKKLTNNPGCGVQMPQLASLGYLNQTEMQCVQSWANGLVMAAMNGGGGNPDAGSSSGTGTDGGGQ
jgi:hypothetical protein